ENNHDWKYTTPRIREALEETGRFTVDVTETPAKTLADANALAKYRVLVLNYNGPRWGEPAETNFLKAGAGRTGVQWIQAADNAVIGWTEYERLVGDLWVVPITGHGAYHAFDVHVVDREHPITRDFPDIPAHPDELYHRLVNTQNVERRVLMTAFSSPDQGGTGEEGPMVLVPPERQGRDFPHAARPRLAGLRRPAARDVGRRAPAPPRRARQRVGGDGRGHAPRRRPERAHALRAARAVPSALRRQDDERLARLQEGRL